MPFVKKGSTQTIHGGGGHLTDQNSCFVKHLSLDLVLWVSFYLLLFLFKWKFGSRPAQLCLHKAKDIYEYNPTQSCKLKILGFCVDNMVVRSFENCR